MAARAQAQAQAFWFFSWWYALGTCLIFIHQFVFIHFVIGNIFMGFNKKKCCLQFTPMDFISFKASLERPVHPGPKIQQIRIL